MTGSKPASPFEQTMAAPPGPGGTRPLVDPLAQTTAGLVEVVAAGSTGEGSAPLGVNAASSPGASMAPVSSTSDPSFLRPFGPFTRVEPLSEQGAMGLVARGYNAAFDRWELLKFLRSEHAQHTELLRQFQREGRVLARLSHPNVVQVFAIYALDGQPCLAMEFLEGESLQAHAARHDGRLPIGRWYELFLAAARGLSAAHEVGLLHRDLKPENLFVLTERKGASGVLKLIDFGLATADRTRRDVAHDPSMVAALSGGTPLYMAPELWRQQEATPRSDLYALGLCFFVTATGRLPYEVGKTASEVALAVCSEGPFLDARDLRPELPAPLSTVLRRLIAKAADERFESADELVAALVAASSEARTRRVPGSGPYRGLSSFSSSERDVFFGREDEVVEVLERLRGQGGLVLVGPSGSGKSSLAHAGVVPAIEEGALGAGLVFRATRFEPRTQPLSSLAAALARVVPTAEKDLLAFLRATPERLGEALRAGLPPGVGLLLVVDQLEELATLCRDPLEAASFARAVGSMLDVPTPELRVLATLRADLMDRLFTLEPLRPLLTRGFYPVRPLLGEGLRRALLGPMQAAGYHMEDPAIADAILADVAHTTSGLPLMSFAMSSWWQERDEARRMLPAAAWRALGGLAGALARHGDGVLEGMGREERAAAEQILARLVSAEGTRARATRGALLDPAAAGPGAERALERLLQAKLLHESGGEVELAHEALISRWPTLQRLLSSSGEDRAFRERVAAAAREWDAQGRPDGALWSDEQAERLLRWFMSTSVPLDQGQLSFIEAVRQRIARRKLLVRSGVFAALALALTFGLVTKRSERELRARLDDTSRRATQVEADYRRSEGGRLRSLAERQLGEDPALALATAFESYEKSPSPLLDLLAWRVRYRGLTFPLPLHRKGSRFVAFSRKGDWIATGGGDGAVHVMATSRPETALVRPSRNDAAVPRAVAFADDALAVGSSVGEVVVARAPKFSPSVVGTCGASVEQVKWAGDALYARCAGPEGKLVRLDRDHLETLLTGDLVGLDASADGALVVSARRPSSLVLVGAGGVQQAPAPAAGLVDVAVSSDGSRLLVAEADGTVRSAPVASGKPGAFTAFTERLNGAPVALGAGPEGASYAVGADRKAKLWLGTRAFSFEVGGPAFAWSAARKLLLVPTAEQDVLVVSLLTGESVGRLQGAIGPVNAIRVSERGGWALVGSEDGATRGYPLDAASARVTRGALSPAPRVCAVSPDGTAVGCAQERTLSAVPVQGASGGGRELRVELPAAPSLLAFGPQAATWATAGAGVWTIRGSSGEAAGRALSGVATPTALVVGAQHVALAGKQADGAGALLIASSEGGEGRAVPIDEHPLALALSSDGQRLLAATAEGNVVVVDVGTARIIRVLPLEGARLEGEPVAMALSDDAGTVVVGSRAGVLATTSTGRPTAKRLGKLAAAVACLAWGQAGRLLVAATVDQRRQAIDADTGQTFPLGYSTSPAVGCARSAIDDRFSFVLADGSAFVRAIDGAPLTMSKVPEPTLDPRTMPLAQWRGLPEVWR